MSTLPPIIVTLSTVPRRAHLLEQAVGELRALADVRVHHAPEVGDSGPVWKWIAPQDVDPHAVVVVVDDDLQYTRERVLDLVEDITAHAAGTSRIVQGLGYSVRIRDNAADHGGAYLDGRAVSAATQTDIVQAFAGLALRGSDFVALRCRLLEDISVLRRRGLWELARIADDYVVSRAARRLGMRAIALPMPGPEQLPTSDDAGALWRIAPGHVARYTALLHLEQHPLWWQSGGGSS